MTIGVNKYLRWKTMLNKIHQLHAQTIEIIVNIIHLELRSANYIHQIKTFFHSENIRSLKFFFQLAKLLDI